MSRRFFIVIRILFSYNHALGAKSVYLFIYFINIVINYSVIFAQISDWQTDSITLQPVVPHYLKKKNLVFNQWQIRCLDNLPNCTVCNLKGQQLNEKLLIDAAAGRFWLKDSSCIGMQVIFKYKYFIDALPDTIALRTLKAKANAEVADSLSRADGIGIAEAIQDRRNRNFDIFDQNQIQRSGSITRGITIGTNRDLAVNSDFRLQLQGKVGPDIELAASMTDNNLPIQPSGTTQQISDFDRIFFLIKRKNLSLTIGDFEVTQTGTQFSNIYRNVLGVQARRQKIIADSGRKIQLSGSATESKGRFHSNSFAGQNGRQGPYRLTGRQGETFLIVLAGSEKVFVNGELMRRGQDQDYIIEYNTGELIFTSRRLITSATRIVVDFEYSDRNYGRSLLLGTIDLHNSDDRIRFKLIAGREADDPTNPINITLSEPELVALSNAGDNPLAARLSGIDSLRPFDRKNIFYAKKDTIVNNQLYTGIFVYATDSLTARFSLTFLFVGRGNGNYTLESTLVNNRVYRWTAPDSLGNKTGDYEPIRVIPLPKELINLNFSSTYIQPIGKKGVKFEINTENALSIEDQNRLSKLDDNNNTDYAGKTTLRLSELKINHRLSAQLEIAGQYVGKSYTNFDRVYKMEYGRDWNFNDLGTRNIEKIIESKLQLALLKKYFFSAGYAQRVMADSLNTGRIELNIQSTDTQHINGRQYYTRIITYDNKLATYSIWNRSQGFWKWKVLKWLEPGMDIWFENRSNEKNRRLQSGSFRFLDLKPQLRLLPQRTHFSFDIAYNYRKEYGYRLDTTAVDSIARLAPKSILQSWQYKVSWQPVSGFNLQQNFSLLRFRVLDTLFRQSENTAATLANIPAQLTDTGTATVNSGFQNQQNVLAVLQLNYFHPNRVFQVSGGYEISSELIAKRQIIYLEVLPGQGQFEWIDYNRDGIQDLEEFQPAINPLTANYMKIFVPTRELIPAIGVTTTATLRTDFQQLKKNNTALLLTVLRHLSSYTSFRFEQKSNITAPKLKDYWFRPSDTSLLNELFNLRQDVYLFRNHPKGDIGIVYLQNNNQLLLNSGLERRKSRSFQLTGRLTLSTTRSIELSGKTGNKTNFAQLMPGRNYNIDFQGINPIFIWQFSRRFRINTGYEFQFKTNQDENNQINSRVSHHKLVLDSRYAFGTRNTFTGRLELSRISQQGIPAEPTANFELLEGLQNGSNAVWSFLLTQYLTRSLELNLVYDGRSAQTIPPVHSMRVQLRANF